MEPGGLNVERVRVSEDGDEAHIRMEPLIKP